MPNIQASITRLYDWDTRIRNFRDKLFVHGIKAIEIVRDPSAPGGLNSGREIVDLRTYRSRSGSTWYACAWVFIPELPSGEYGSGAGIANGANYDLESAAASEALQGTGIQFSERFSGYGLDAIEEAVRAVANLTRVPYIIVRMGG